MVSESNGYDVLTCTWYVLLMTLHNGSTGCRVHVMVSLTHPKWRYDSVRPATFITPHLSNNDGDSDGDDDNDDDGNGNGNDDDDNGGNNGNLLL
jgi:hypothetical protein